MDRVSRKRNMRELVEEMKEIANFSKAISKSGLILLRYSTNQSNTNLGQKYPGIFFLRKLLLDRSHHKVFKFKLVSLEKLVVLRVTGGQSYQIS